MMINPGIHTGIYFTKNIILFPAYLCILFRYVLIKWREDFQTYEKIPSACDRSAGLGLYHGSLVFLLFKINKKTTDVNQMRIQFPQRLKAVAYMEYYK